MVRTKGLHNLEGKTCFINAALQLLIRSPNVLEELARHTHDANGPPECCPTCSVRDVFQEMISGPTHESISPTKILKLVEAKERCINCEWQELKTMELFQLKLPLEERNTFISVQNCIDTLEHIRVTDRLCPSCRRRKTVSVQDFMSFPDNLVIMIPRGTPYGGKIKNTVQANEEITVKIENLTPHKYRLVGIVEHEGDSALFGHYWFVVKSGDGWTKLEDHHPPKMVEKPGGGNSSLFLYTQIDEIPVIPANSTAPSDVTSNVATGFIDASLESDYLTEWYEHGGIQIPTNVDLDEDMEMGSVDISMQSMEEPMEGENINLNGNDMQNDTNSSPQHETVDVTVNEGDSAENNISTAPDEYDSTSDAETVDLCDTSDDEDDMEDLHQRNISEIGRGTTNVEEIKRSIKQRYIEKVRNYSIDAEIVVVFLFPSSCKGQPLSEIWQSLKKSNLVIPFTITNPNSGSYKKLKKDTFITTLCNMRTMRLNMRYGEWDQLEWIAKIGIYFILHANLCKTSGKPRFEFFADKGIMGLTTRAVVLYWEKIRNEIRSYTHHIKQGDLFCVLNCGRKCPLRTKPWHFVLNELQEVEYSSDASLSVLSSKIIRNNDQDDEDHPLQPLLNCRKMMKMKEVDTILRDLSTCSLKGYKNKRTGARWVYVLLLVTGIRDPEASDLLKCSFDPDVKLKYYVGMSCDERYNRQHFKLPKEGKMTTVQRELSNGATAFLVLSEKFENYADAACMESAYICICKLQKILDNIDNKRSQFELLNKRSEFKKLLYSSEELIKDIINYMETETRLIRLKGQELKGLENIGRLKGNCLVTERLQSW